MRILPGGPPSMYPDVFARRRCHRLLGGVDAAAAAGRPAPMLGLVLQLSPSMGGVTRGAPGVLAEIKQHRASAPPPRRSACSPRGAAEWARDVVGGRSTWGRGQKAPPRPWTSYRCGLDLLGRSAWHGATKSTTRIFACACLRGITRIARLFAVAKP